MWSISKQVFNINFIEIKGKTKHCKSTEKHKDLKYQKYFEQEKECSIRFPGFNLYQKSMDTK